MVPEEKAHFNSPVPKILLSEFILVKLMELIVSPKLKNARSSLLQGILNLPMRARTCKWVTARRCATPDVEDEVFVLLVVVVMALLSCGEASLETTSKPLMPPDDADGAPSLDLDADPLSFLYVKNPTSNPPPMRQRSS